MGRFEIIYQQKKEPVSAAASLLDIHGIFNPVQGRFPCAKPFRPPCYLRGTFERDSKPNSPDRALDNALRCIRPGQIHGALSMTPDLEDCTGFSEKRKNEFPSSWELSGVWALSRKDDCNDVFEGLNTSWSVRASPSVLFVGGACGEDEFNQMVEACEANTTVEGLVALYKKYIEDQPVYNPMEYAVAQAMRDFERKVVGNGCGYVLALQGVPNDILHGRAFFGDLKACLRNGGAVEKDMLCTVNAVFKFSG